MREKTNSAIHSEVLQGSNHVTDLEPLDTLSSAAFREERTLQFRNVMLDSLVVCALLVLNPVTESREAVRELGLKEVEFVLFR